MSGCDVWHSTQVPPMTVLFVCTANICRSPYAAAAFNSAAQQAGLDARALSAGVRVDLLEVSGQPTCDEMPYDEPRPKGSIIERPSAHGATQLTVEAVREADLIAVFEPSHRSHVIQLHPRAQLTTYTIRQLARFATAISEIDWPGAAPAPTGDVLRDLNLARSWAPFSTDDAVPDPHGHGVDAHRASADVVDQCVVALIRAMQIRHADFVSQ